MTPMQILIDKLTEYQKGFPEDGNNQQRVVNAAYEICIQAATELLEAEKKMVVDAVNNSIKQDRRMLR